MKEKTERIEYIKTAHEAAINDKNNNNWYSIKNWRNDTLYRKIISIDIDNVIFRIENSRTEVQQLAYIHKHGLPENFFDDPESSKVQEAQEKILIDMIKSKKETGMDFLEDLRIRGQDDPAIITYDGILVNGNRRTAALKFLKERYIKCVILPEDARPRDIYILEQQLQITQDFREDYHWINELRNIRKGLDDKRLKLTEEEVAENLRLDEGELKEKMFMLELVDSFLLWRKIPNQYDYALLNDANQIFIELEKARRNRTFRNDSVKYNDLKNAIFTLLESKPKSRSVYYYVSNLIKNFDQIRARLIPKPTESGPATNSGSTLDQLIDAGKEEVRPILFNNFDSAAENSKLLTETVADVRAENKEKEDAEYVYDSVSNALRQLTGLTIDQETAKVQSVKSKLEEILIISSDLIKQIDTISNTQN